MSVYKGRLLMLAEKIENPEETPSFNMCGYERDCGTPMCVAGWAIHFWGSMAQARRDMDYSDRAGDILGLIRGQSRPLFAGDFSDRYLPQITREETAAELRRLAALA